MRRRLRIFLIWIAIALAAFYAGFALSILSLRWINPVTTSVQIQRRLEALFAHRKYQKRCAFVRLNRISKELQHATIAAEDGRFYQHHGFDWIEMQKIVKQDLEKHKLGRGGSTITQQLVKNLYLTTKRSLIRKGLEFALVPVAELLLPKDRILELYLNVIEWGPGVYGAEAASEYYYHEPAARIGRDHAARLAACIPNPLARRPASMSEYGEEILWRMGKMGW